MSDFKIKEIKVNSEYIKHIMQSQEMMDVLLDEGEKLGTIETSFVGFDRCHVVVKEK